MVAETEFKSHLMKPKHKLTMRAEVRSEAKLLPHSNFTQSAQALVIAGPCSRQSSRTHGFETEARTRACASQSMSDQKASGGLV